jgi:transcriptional regulator GlxA family with amidase domain
MDLGGNEFGNRPCAGLVESDLGSELARAVAKRLVVYHRRPGGQSQFSALLELEPKSDRVQKALDYAKQNLHTPLTLNQLSGHAVVPRGYRVSRSIQRLGISCSGPKELHEIFQFIGCRI